MQAMAAVVREAKGDFLLEEVDVDEPRADEVLVRVVASGICHTDVAVQRQEINLPLPMVVGHEGSGVVEAVGSAVTHVKPGDHVVLSGDSCGQCRHCHEGAPSYCDEFIERNLSGQRTDGSSPLKQKGHELLGRFVGQSSFATYSLSPWRSVIKVDQNLPIELMGPLGCGLTTGFGTVINAIKPPAGSSIVVFGVGTVGLAAIMGARETGCEKIIAVDMKPARLDMATEMGATHCINPETSNAVSEIRALTHGGADFSVECSGAPTAVREAVDCLGRPGWAAQVGATPGGIEIPFSMDNIGLGRGIKGVVMGDAAAQTFVPYLASLWRDGRLPYDKFVKYYDFADINQAVHDSAITGEVIKPILRMP
ncbi:MAG: NAD(P)-dependent alcohol dehydrogenase [Alphaproteobacteria bacterium]